MFSVKVLCSKFEVASQIMASYDFVVGEFFWCSSFKHLTFEDEICSVGDRQSLVGVMVGDEHADVLVFQFCHDTLDVFNSDRVDAGEWFVEEYEFRVDGECSCNLSSASFAAR